MIIVVNHLTRMRENHVCVAGVDLETGRHVRPVLAWGHLAPDVLSRNGGPFDIGNVVDLGAAKHCPQKPHVEDHGFRPSEATFVERFRDDDFWALLYSVSKPRLEEIFGSDLKRLGRSSCGTEVGKGEASLGCLRPTRTPRLQCGDRGQSGKPRIRIDVDDGHFRANVSVTDLRLYHADHATPDRRTVTRIAQRLKGPGAVILGVGLTRAFAASIEGRQQHWLQVNNVHLEADPTWQLG